MIKTIVEWIEDRKLWGWVIAGFIAGLISLGYIYERTQTRGGFFAALEAPLIDMRYNLLSTIKKPNSDIVIVPITEQTIQSLKSQYGNWPWPREAFNNMTRYLRQARAVAFNVPFYKSEKNLTPIQLRSIRENLRRLQTDNIPKNKNQQFEEIFSILSTKNTAPLVKTDTKLPLIYTVDFLEGPFTLDPSAKEKLKDNYRNILNEYGMTINNSPEGMGYELAAIPTFEVLQSARSIGHTNWEPGVDRTIRKIPPTATLSKFDNASIFQTQAVPSFGLAVAKFINSDPANKSINTSEESTLTVGSKWRIPLDRHGNMLINYRSHYSDYTTISATQLAIASDGNSSSKHSNLPDPSWFSDKIVLIGSTSRGKQPHTPFRTTDASLTVWVNQIETLVNNDFLTPVRTSETVAFILILTLTIGVISTFLPPIRAFIFTVLLSILYVVVWGVGLFQQNHIVNISAPLLSANMTYVLVVVYNLFYANKQKLRLRSTLEQCLPNNVLKEVLNNPDLLDLGGKRKEISVIFADVAGFTRFCEGQDAREVADFINSILTELTKPVFDHQGVLDKYIGDALVAEFGMIPVEPAGHPDRACHTALEMRKSLHKLQEEWLSMNRPVMKLRIGIHTGAAATGNMGSDLLFDYTAIGDNMNLASRVEQANKHYGTQILITETTYNQITDDFILREIDRIRVAGRNEPITIYELIGLEEEVSDRNRRLVDKFEKGLSLYRERKWDEAINVFNKLQTRFPEDSTASVFISRCYDYKENPPDPTWDGVYSLTKSSSA